MDHALSFKPNKILLWRQVKDEHETQRILTMFPGTEVQEIDHQRMAPAKSISHGQALREGKRILMIGNTSQFVGSFDGRLGQKVKCCPYYKLIPLSNGCPYYCTYCYLAFVYRKYHPYIKLNINHDLMFRQIRRAADGTDKHANFNMGEMMDSLALDHVSNLTPKLIPFFGKLQNSYLMLLTKSSNVGNLLATEPNDHIVVSWTLNSSQIIDKYELGTANLDERIQAARLCQEHGYRIRFRIDPGIIYANWKHDYAELIKKALTCVKPENITLGMLRLLPGHKKLSIDAYGEKGKELAAYNLVAKASDNKTRFHLKERIDFYNHLIDVIREFDKDVSISLCRETQDVWEKLKDRCQAGKCNCVTW